MTLPYDVEDCKRSSMQRAKAVEGVDEQVAPERVSGVSEIPPPPWAATRARRAKRAARPPLDRDQIVTAALGIVDEEGVEALSLRRLAQSLRVTPMSIYWHVRDKAELLELVGLAVLADIEIPPPRGTWREQVKDLHRAMLVGLLKHPNALDVLIGRARYGAAGVTMFERLLLILLGAGLPPEAAFDAYMALYEYLLGFAAVANRTPGFREMQQQGVLYLRSLPPERFPSIARVASVIGRHSLEEQFEIGLAAMIEGIAETLIPSAVEARAPTTLLKRSSTSK
jgi:AcrR family transcriptional regulator